MVFSRIDVKDVFLSNRFRKGLLVKLHNKKVFYILSLFRLINTFSAQFITLSLNKKRL